MTGLGASCLLQVAGRTRLASRCPIGRHDTGRGPGSCLKTRVREPLVIFFLRRLPPSLGCWNPRIERRGWFWSMIYMITEATDDLSLPSNVSLDSTWGTEQCEGEMSRLTYCRHQYDSDVWTAVYLTCSIHLQVLYITAKMLQHYISVVIAYSSQASMTGSGRSFKMPQAEQAAVFLARFHVCV